MVRIYSKFDWNTCLRLSGRVNNDKTRFDRGRAKRYQSHSIMDWLHPSTFIAIPSSKRSYALSLSERRFDKSFVISLFQRSINRYGSVDLNFPPPFSIIIRRDRRFEKIIDLEKYLKKKNNQSYLSEQFKKFSTQKLSIDRIY